MSEPRVLRETRFASQRLDPIGVEILTLSELRARVSAKLFGVTERVHFYMVLVAIRGRGEHLVDFELFPLRTGQVIFVRPGQVQQWQLRRGLEADLLLIDPAVTLPTARAFQPSTMELLRLEDWPSCFELGSERLAEWRSLATLLRRELGRPLLDEVSAAMARELLLCLMLNVSRCATKRLTSPTTKAILVRRFQSELEGLVFARPSVASLANRLHVSTSTLSRICNEILGHSAKEEVDRRVALEAQRLLIHSAATSVSIGEKLGFTEPTNFLKFFRRVVATTPEGFRHAHRLPPSA